MVHLWQLRQWLHTVLLHEFSCVALQEFSGEDNSDLFLSEREAAILRAQQEKRQIQLTVPGIIGPHELPEEMQD